MPHNIEAGTHLRVTFTVANHEGHNEAYPLVLSSVNLSGVPDKTVLARSTLAVHSGAKRSKTVTVRPACRASSCKVTVSLLGHPESIDVILNVHRAKS